MQQTFQKSVKTAVYGEKNFHRRCFLLNTLLIMTKQTDDKW